MKAFTYLLAAFSLLLPAQAANQIVSGATWTDTSGNVIQAHGAGILKVLLPCLWERVRECVAYYIFRSAVPFTGSARTRSSTARCSTPSHATL